MALFKKKRNSDDIEHIRQKNALGVFKSAGVVFVVLLIMLLASQSAYQIREQEQAVLTTFGKAQAVTTSGLHFKIPFIQHVTKVNTTIQGFKIGYDKDTYETIEDEAIMITSDYNFLRTHIIKTSKVHCENLFVILILYLMPHLPCQFIFTIFLNFLKIF